MWVRGLKQLYSELYGEHYHVAPHVGAWIETVKQWYEYRKIFCRTPCGCVD